MISDTWSIGDINKMHGLAQKEISDIRPLVGRPKINDEQTPARFPAGTLARIDAVLSDGEKRSDFIREAVERELKRRKG
jgi:hypothetical protein